MTNVISQLQNANDSFVAGEDFTFGDSLTSLCYNLIKGKSHRTLSAEEFARLFG